MAVIGSSTPIKSVQRGSIAIGPALNGTSANVSISSINTSKSALTVTSANGMQASYYSGSITAGWNNAITAGGRISSSTQIIIYTGKYFTPAPWGGNLFTGGNCTAYWEVVEYV